ncbi:MAG TPA: hypothetical protein VFK57_21170 [Vicinamibacterales bacterium]|nr:hypothetical protein [Vicinamibacterales bacterium]
MRSAVLLLAALAVASPAAAQERLKEVWVSHADSGEVVRGEIVTLSPESLTILTVDQRRVDLPLSRVLRIETRGDSLKNGLVLGAAIMGGLSLVACQGATNAGQCGAIVGFNAGFGALIGAGIDALNGGRSAVYSRPPAPAPGGAAGLQVRLRF